MDEGYDLKPITRASEMLKHIEVLEGIEYGCEQGSEAQKFWAEIIAGAYKYLESLESV